MIVIPTRFRQPALYPLLDEALTVGQVILVHTEPGHPTIAGTTTVHSSARNIHSWWNAGLDQCEGRALVLNDDIEATATDLRTLLDALNSADLVWAATDRQLPTPISGWCYGIHPEKIRPDETYTWFYGDDDLYKRAVRDNLAVRAVPTNIRHLHDGEPFNDPDMESATHRDRDIFNQRW